MLLAVKYKVMNEYGTKIKMEVWVYNADDEMYKCYMEHKFQFNTVFVSLIATKFGSHRITYIALTFTQS